MPLALQKLSQEADFALKSQSKDCKQLPGEGRTFTTLQSFTTPHHKEWPQQERYVVSFFHQGV